MYKIIIKGEAKTNYRDLKKLDGIDCGENFADYFHKAYNSDPCEQSLIDKGVNNGYMKFKFEDNKLFTITEYSSREKLTKDDLQILADYTQGQWSDGIGEGFEQNPCYYDEDFIDEDDNKGEIYISPWFNKQKVEILQEKLEQITK